MSHPIVQQAASSLALGLDKSIVCREVARLRYSQRHGGIAEPAN